MADHIAAPNAVRGSLGDEDVDGGGAIWQAWISATRVAGAGNGETVEGGGIAHPKSTSLGNLVAGFASEPSANTAVDTGGILRSLATDLGQLASGRGGESVDADRSALQPAVSITLPVEQVVGWTPPAATGTAAKPETVREEATLPVEHVIGAQPQAEALEELLPVERVIEQKPGGESIQTTQSASLIRLTNVRADARFAGIDGSGVSVVIVDTGADLDHSAFGPDANSNGVADRIVYQYDFSGTNDADANDTNGHGTHVAGTIGSQNAGYLGMAPGVNLIVLKVFADGSGTASSTDIEEAAQWVVNNAATYNIVAANFSLGSGNYNSAFATYLNDEFQGFINAGVAPVVATGNSFFTFGSAQGVGQPAADPLAWGVGAVYDANVGGLTFGSGAIDNTTGPDRVTSFSQRSTVSGLVDIFAPGGAITSAHLNNSSATLYGTSMAAPHIAGIVALAQEYAIQLSGSRMPLSTLLGLIRSSAVTINDGDDEDDNVTNTNANYLRVDTFALMEAIQAHYGGGGVPSVTIGDMSITEGNSGTQVATFTVTRTGASGAFNVSYATANGTATAGSDYVATSSTLSFGSGVNAQTVSVTVNGDITSEANETFFVNLSGATGGAVLADSQGFGTINNDDGAVDDYAGSTATTGNVSVGASIAGNIETLADRDWLRVSLTAGSAVNINLRGSPSGVGTLGDTYLRLYDAGGTEIIADDDSGNGLESLLVYSPTSSGTYYIGAAAYSDQYTGTYAVSVAATFTEGADTVAVAQTGSQQTGGTWNALGGNDSVSGSSGTDYMYGGNDNDTLAGGSGLDQLSGDAGNDTLWAGDVGSFTDASNNNLVGGAGNDSMNGGAAIDSLYGDDGLDTLNGGAGIDYLVGGYDNSADLLNGGGDGDNLYGFGGADTLNGDDGADGLYGGEGNDTVAGGAGLDFVMGEGGDDTMWGDVFGSISELTNNTLVGVDGNDTMHGAGGIDAMYGDNGADLMSGYGGIDYMVGGYDLSSDTLNGGDGGDNLYGFGGDDALNGGNDGDGLYGGDGLDTMHGDAGDDFMMGEGGNDNMYGDAGNDVLVGGGGNDIFFFGDGWSHDQLHGFELGVDRINMQAVTGLNTFSQLSINNVNGSSQVIFGGNTIFVLGIAPAALTASHFDL